MPAQSRPLPDHRRCGLCVWGEPEGCWEEALCLYTDAGDDGAGSLEHHQIRYDTKVPVPATNWFFLFFYVQDAKIKERCAFWGHTLIYNTNYHFPDIRKMILPFIFTNDLVLDFHYSKIELYLCFRRSST